MTECVAVVSVNERMMHFRSFVVRFASLAQGAGVIFQGVVLIITDEFSVSADKATVENPTRQTLIVVGFYGLQISDRNPGLLRYVAQSNPSRLACESQFF